MRARSIDCERLHMVEEHLSAIRSREQEAKRRIRETGADADAILDAAREEGEKRLEQVRAEASDSERTLLAEARKRAEEKIAAMRAENDGELNALESTAGENEERALEIMSESFLGEL